MRNELATVTIEHRIAFSMRELQLLQNLLSYDIEKYVKTITPNSYEGGVSQEEMIKFVGILHATVNLSVTSVKQKLKKLQES